MSRAITTANTATVNNPIVARDIYLRKIDGMVFGDDPAQGIVEGRQFIHPELKFEFTVPPGFVIRNTPSAVFAQGEAGAGLKFDLDKGDTTLGMKNYIKNIWAPNARLTHLSAFSVDGLDAASAIIPGGQNGRADVRLVAIGLDSNTVYRFVFILPQDNGATVDREYRKTTFSWRRISEEEASRIKPKHLHIYEVREGDTLTGIVNRFSVAPYPMDRFLVLNGLTRDTALRTGERVKVVY